VIGAAVDLGAFESQRGDRAPTAADAAVTASQNASTEITLSAGDPDPGDTLTYHLLSLPQHGKLTGAAPKVTYTPDPGYAGPDGFTFFVTDSQGLKSNVATVSITVVKLKTK
jgi:hypothetical protein